jgi:uncharacterized protein YbgA (DUF1722 family)
MDAVAGIRTIDLALHLVGIRDSNSLATKARRDLGDAVDAYRAGDEPTAMATATDLAEEIRQARQSGRGAAA